MSLQLLSNPSARGCGHLRSSVRRPALNANCNPARRAVLVRAEPISAPSSTVGPKRAKHVTDDNFAEVVLKNNKPVLVDFWAPWCGPCRMISTVIDELAATYQDKVTFTKLNTDESPKTAQAYSIRSIPTVIIFKNGQKMESIIGAVPKANLEQAINKYL